MEKQLAERLQKAMDENNLEGHSAPYALKLAIAVIEAVKASRIATGFYDNLDIQACDHVSGFLRRQR